MRVIYSTDQERHAPLGEFNRGVLGQPYERPQRARELVGGLRSAGLTIETPDAFPVDPIARVHDAGYLAFLESVHSEWRAAGRDGDAFPLAFPIRSFRSDRPPVSLDGRVSYYAFDISTVITEGTWQTIRASADCALTAARDLVHDGRSLALCRPPGHHAGRDFFGGYCFINNAAVAAQALRDAGAERVAILDVDYHHGNGTQAIFYDRSDVLYASIHADPATDFPYFLGYADETGMGAGEGANCNIPLPRGTVWSTYSDALDVALGRVKAFGADATVVSLGIDTFAADPLSHFQLTNDDFAKLGAALGTLGTPTMFVMEGGYAIDDLGANLVRILHGIEGT